MSASATPTSGAPAPTSGPSAGDLMKSWAITAALLGLLYAYLQGNVQSPWLKVIYQGFPIAVVFSFMSLLISGQKWSKGASIAMALWALSIAPQVAIGVDEMISQALLSQSDHLAAAYDRAKEKAYLNRAADLTPSLSEAREEIYKSTMRMEMRQRDKMQQELAVIDQYFSNGVDGAGAQFGLNEYRSKIQELYPSLHLGDQIHEEAMREVKGPERPKIAPRIWGVPHIITLLVALGLAVFGSKMLNGMPKAVVVIAAVLACMNILGTGVIPEMGSSGVNFNLRYIERHMSTLMLIGMIGIGIFMSFMKKSQAAGGH